MSGPHHLVTILPAGGSVGHPGDVHEHQAPRLVLYDQTDNPDLDSFNSQNFEAAYDEYDNQGADDFVVSAAGWVVTTVVTPGAYFNGAGPAPSLHVTFYNDAGGLPGAVVAGCDYPSVTSFTGGATGSFTTTLSPPCTLSPGPKWVSVQANMDFLAGGQWGWTMRDAQSFNPSVWRNPGGAFPGGCLTYTPRINCEPLTASSPDQVFRLEGLLASCSADADCQDGNLCNGAEHCVANACTPGTPVNCNDGLFCTIDSCDPGTGACSNAPNPCSDGDSCSLDFCNEAADACTHVSPPVIRICNTDAIAIPDSGTSTPYPSTISVSGLSPVGGLCSVELKGISHTFPGDIDMLVVGPGTPQNAIVMSDVGGGTAVTSVNLTLKDAAALPIPTPLVSGTFKPTNTGVGDTFAGAPTPTGGSALSAFDGTNPNGDWALYVVDDASGDFGSVAGGWCVNLVVSGCSSDANCNDGNFCNGIETCVAGTCAPGTPINCDDGLFCTIDACNPSNGACGHSPNLCSDGNSCTLDSCDESNDACVNTNAALHFCNTGAVSIPDSGAGTPYPSPIIIAGLPTVGSVCSVELFGITHTFPDDIDILLARASGTNALIMSDVGGGTAVAGVNLTLNDAAAASLPDGPTLVSGTFRPANYDTFGADSAFPAPAPAISGSSALSTFDGGNPNGIWNLWVRDEFTPDSGVISGGWCLDVVVTACTTNPECNDGDACNGVETCVAGACAPGTPVNCSDGQFCTLDTCDPATGTCGHPPNPCSDGDSCTLDFCDEANDACTHVTPPPIHVCNTGAIAIPDSGTGTPYPSTITVAGLSTTASLCSVELSGITHTFPADIDMLLVGPGTPQNAIVMSDVGGGTPVTGINLMLKDSAGGSIPTPLVSGSFKPTNVGAGDTFAGAPAPTGGSALSVFDGTNPNGNWSLFVVDDAGGDSGSVAGGWCVNLVVNACTADAECNDGNSCNGTETCVAGTCTPGTPLNCNDGQFCTIDTCDPPTGTCGHTPNPCSDGDSCTADSCDEANDICVHAAATCFSYDQTDFPSDNAFNSQNFEAIYDQYDDQLADDFVVPSTGWVVSTVVTPGVYFNGAGPATSLHVTFYENDGTLPGAIVPGCDYPSVTTFTGASTGSFTTTLSPPCTLSPGPKWVSVQANMDFTVGGQWGWTMRNVQSFNPSVWRNPGGGFPGGCLTYTPRGICDPTTATSPDQSFRLDGSVPGCAVNADCQDGDACNGAETCVVGVCTPGTPLVCNDGNACNGVETCSPATGCVSGTPVVCVASDQCHNAGTCTPGTGLCSNPTKPNGTTCDDGNASTSGDSCQGGVCTGLSCTSTNDPKTKGWYKSLCHNSHSGDSLTNADAACVGALTTTFHGITTVSQICAVLEPSIPNNDKCTKAEDQLMTLALNICKQRVCPSNGIDSSCGNNGSVAQSLAESDAIFANPSRTTAQCDHAECLDQEINNGHALELDSLLITRENGNVRLNWTAPILDDGTGTPQGYKIWRRTVGSSAPFVQIGTTNRLTFLDVTTGTGSWQYNLTPVN